MQNYTLEQVKAFCAAASLQSGIYVGCDSTQTLKHTVFVGVIILHIDGNKGARIFPFVRQERRIKSLKQRLWGEVSLAMELAMELSTVITPSRIEVHLDLNPSPRHKSNVVVKDALSYVLSQGMVARIKPDALAASSAGDYITRKERYSVHI